MNLVAQRRIPSSLGDICSSEVVAVAQGMKFPAQRVKSSAQRPTSVAQMVMSEDQRVKEDIFRE